MGSFVSTAAPCVSERISRKIFGKVTSFIFRRRKKFEFKKIRKFKSKLSSALKSARKSKVLNLFPFEVFKEVY